MNERTKMVNGKYKWQVKGVKQNNGYFGAYSCIEVDGKFAVVYCDDRDALVKVITDWYDAIEWHNDWSGDYRWNDDKPIVVYDKEKGYSLNAPHTDKLLCDWLSEIIAVWKYDRNIGNYLKGVKDGKNVYITEKGNIINANVTSTNYEVVLKACKSMTNDEVRSLWIEKGLPCAHIRGMEYKGSVPHKIDKDTALEMFETHNHFNCMFNSAEWRVLDGEVTLLMRDYANSDYD